MQKVSAKSNRKLVNSQSRLAAVKTLGKRKKPGNWEGKPGQNMPESLCNHFFCCWTLQTSLPHMAKRTLPFWEPMDWSWAFSIRCKHSPQKKCPSTHLTRVPGRSSAETWLRKQDAACVNHKKAMSEVVASRQTPSISVLSTKESPISILQTKHRAFTFVEVIHAASTVHGGVILIVSNPPVDPVKDLQVIW